MIEFLDAEEVLRMWRGFRLQSPFFFDGFHVPEEKRFPDFVRFGRDHLRGDAVMNEVFIHHQIVFRGPDFRIDQEEGGFS